MIVYSVNIDDCKPDLFNIKQTAIILDGRVSILHWSLNFPNPFDAYFYLLENYKESEIV
jgi:hypothetical protein